MSYRQAFHTSCRSGLSGHAGFQFNAASSGLDQEQLTRLAAEHSGYRPPPDAPSEPGPSEIVKLPVALRYLPVEGVGPVVSRTVYVGREFRGVGSEADSGRFGNYFSHIVVGDDADEAFGGLLPIELWGAGHWSTTEAEQTELPVLTSIEPGGLDLERILEELRPRGTAALAAVADAGLRAVLGGPRVVIVEPEADLGAAWVGWATFVLPPGRAAQLTFATFEGRPRIAEAVRLCVTTPACDVDFPPYELQSAVTVIDAASPPPVAGLSLYGRVVESLAGVGAEAVAAAVNGMPLDVDLAGAGAELAVAARRAELAVATDVRGVVATLRRRLGAVATASLAEQATLLPTGEGSGEEFAEWTQLYAAARESGDPEATDLVDVALDRLLPSLSRPPAALPAVDPEAPAVPSAGALAKWLERVSAADEESLGPLLAAGVRLGLIGCNTALDKELVAPIARRFADPLVQSAYTEIALMGNARVVEGVALELAAAAGAGGDLELLKHAAAEPLAREAVRANATETGDFESVAAWELLRAGSPGADRGGVVEALAARATTGGHEAAIRRLYGESGPQSAAEHAELLEGWHAAGRQAADADYERALACLAGLPFGQAEEAGPLLRALAAGPRASSGDVEVVAWRLRCNLAPERQPFRDWAEAASSLRRRGREIGLAASREEELRRLAAQVAVESLGEGDYPQGIEILLRGMGRDWAVELGDALARRVERSVNPRKQIIDAFVDWHGAKRCRDSLLEVALPRATRDLPVRELEAVGEDLNRQGREVWQSWLEDHPPRRAVSRAVRGVFRRGEER
jgi:hypothetical protein